MLRSNRKNSPPGIGGGGINSSTLPSYYNGHHHNGGSHEAAVNGTTTNGHSTPPPPPFQRRRRRHIGKGSHNKGCCSKWGALFIVVSCLGTYFMFHRNETAADHFHRAIKTLADPPPRLIPAINVDSNANANAINTNTNSNNLQQQAQRRTTIAKSTTPILPPKPSNNGVYDIIVLGAGPAGLTAALFAARAGLSVLVFGSDAGSLSETERLENFPSWQFGAGAGDGGGGGPLWLQTTKQQAAQWGATFAQAGLLVEKLQKAPTKDDHSGSFSLEIRNKSFQTNARAVIVATGATGRRLQLPLEDTLWGKSVHSCAVCDGSSYVNKVVVVVGGGDAAVDGALLLARYAKRVVLVHRRMEFRATNTRNIELLKTTTNIQLEIPYTISKLETTKTKKRNLLTNTDEEHHILTAVHLRHTDETTTTTPQQKRIVCDGVFELIGSTPNTDWLKGSGAQLDEEGFLVLSNTNPTGETTTRTATSLDGVFAAGEVTDQIYRQAITAAAEGAEAAMDAERWLRNHPLPEQADVATQKRHRSSTIPLQTVLLAVEQHDGTPEQQQDRVIQQLEPEKPNPPRPEEDDDACDLTQQECIMKTVDKYPVVVFSKPWCPYCRKALEALAAEGLPEGHANLHVVDLSLLGKKTKLVQSTLESITGRRTVPNVFVAGASIGGGDETSKFHREGKLHGMLIRAKAIPQEEDNVNSAKGSPCNDLTQEACIVELVNRYPVVVFTKPGCPYCRKAFEALALEGLPKQSPNLHVVDLRSMTNGAQIQGTLQALTGRRTVPNVFVAGSSVGGGDETTKFQRQGKLHHMLVRAKAIVE